MYTVKLDRIKIEVQTTCNWYVKLNNKMKVLVFDTETSGLPTERNASIYETEKWPHILQLSYIVYDIDTNELITVENDYIKIDSSVIVNPESTKIHCITHEQLNNGILIVDALLKFNKYASNCDLIVAHNVSFDKRMIIVEGIRNNIKMDVHTTYCTMKSGINICKIEKVSTNGEKYFKYPTLSELHNELFQTIPKNTHNALIDILICMRCFCKMEKNIDISRVNRTIRLMLRESY